MKKLTNKLIKEWSEMTDLNLHYEVRLEIAKWAEIKDGYMDGVYISYEKCFEELLNVVQNCGRSMIVCECTLTHYMLEDIGRIYGEEVKRLINSCL